ncbi:hypothetical protein B0H14DRAFT_2571815 [Mycena olivaceomarginata]|nr:hypothetical protein B0H14DRAFT_2571815 [Mycena olivaceomarginata]
MREEGDERLGDGVLHWQRRVPELSQETCDFGVVESPASRGPALRLPRLCMYRALALTQVAPQRARTGAKIVPALQDELFSGAWLTIMSRLRPTRHYAEARWFRPAQARASEVVTKHEGEQKARVSFWEACKTKIRSFSLLSGSAVNRAERHNGRQNGGGIWQNWAITSDCFSPVAA